MEAEGKENRTADETEMVPTEGKGPDPEDDGVEAPVYVDHADGVDVVLDAGDEDLGDSGSDVSEDEEERLAMYAPDDEEMGVDAGADSDDPMETETLKDESEASVEAHKDAVLTCALCPADPTLIATGSQDETAAIWKLGSKKFTKVKALEGHTDSVTCIQWSADSAYLATASYDCTVRIWKADGTLVHALDGPSMEVEWLQWHPKGHALLAGSTDCTAWMWWAPTGKLMQVFAGHTSAVSCGAFGKAGQVIVTGSLDNTAIVWNPRQGTPSFHHKNLHEGGIISIACHPTQPILVTGGEDALVKVLSLDQGKVLATLAGHTDSVELVSFCPDESQHLLATGALDGKLQIWDTRTYEVRVAMDDHAADGGITKGKWHPHGHPFIITASTDTTLRVYNAKNGELKKTFRGHHDGVLDMDVACLTEKGAQGFGQVRVVSASDDKNLKAWTAVV